MSKQNSEYITLVKRSIFWLTLMVVVVCATYYFQGSIYENNFNLLPVSTATKELPIYYVDTDKKQVALSFDAAWGDGKMRK